MLLVRGQQVITMNRGRDVVTDGAVAVDGGTIVGVGSHADLRTAHPEATELGSPDAVVTPGFINAHQHVTADRLIRSSIPDDLGLGEALERWALPAYEGITPDEEELASTLHCAEAVTYGTTTTIEAGTVAAPERVAAGMAAVGMRGAVGRWGWEDAVVPDLPDGGLIDGWVTLVGHDLMTDETLVEASRLARDSDTMLTFHISPSDADVVSYLERTGRRPLVHFEQLGALGPHVLLAHAVHLDDAEVDALLRSGAAIAYCPWAYLRLGQGVSGAGRHEEILERGGRLALGCDAENASDSSDVLRTAALAAGLAKDMAADPTRMSAATALELATVRGAEAVGLSDRVGSIEVGKRADLVVHELTGIPRPLDPVLELVWGSGHRVTDVLIDGRAVVRDGACVTVDTSELRAAATAAQQRLLAMVRPSDQW